ncbi:hypothetical protein D2Q93_02100 [Alicyclobacillaceae bacterium I2511]|nr:hypothetical protein D2Q93_02100 [Alicyclobacillaceae bacterium I2511]
MAERLGRLEVGPRTRDMGIAVGLYMLNRVLTLVGPLVRLHGQLDFSKLTYLSVIWAGIHDDATWYAAIADKGYWRQVTPFFPAYPTLIHLTQWGTGLNLADAGLFVANAFFVLDIYMMILLGKRVFSHRVGVMAAGLLTLWPVAFFMTSMYTEPLFIFAILGSLLACVENKPIAAGLWGVLAALTRNEGVLLVLPLLGLAWKDWRASRRLPLRPILGIGLVAGGTLLYMFYLLARYHNPLVFVSEEHLWGRQFLVPWLTLWHGFAALPWLLEHTTWAGRVYYLLQVGGVIVALATLPWAWTRVPHSWFWFLAFMIVIPLSDPGTGVETIVMRPRHIEDYFFSFARFTLPMIPLFFVLAQGLAKWRHSWARNLVFGLSSASLALLSIPLDYHIFLG